LVQILISKLIDGLAGAMTRFELNAEQYRTAGRNG
jgi:hypothetical protein